MQCYANKMSITFKNYNFHDIKPGDLILRKWNKGKDKEVRYITNIRIFSESLIMQYLYINGAQEYFECGEEISLTVVNIMLESGTWKLVKQ